MFKDHQVSLLFVRFLPEGHDHLTDSCKTRIKIEEGSTGPTALGIPEIFAVGCI